MPFRIAPFAGQTYARPYASHEDIRAYLGWGKLVEEAHWSPDVGAYTRVQSQKLPMGFAGWTMVPLTDGREVKLICLKGNPTPEGAPRYAKSSKHRCFAVCPDCGTHVPAGRTHQHKCKGVAA
jgi:hypothetical protein